MANDPHDDDRLDRSALQRLQRIRLMPLLREAVGGSPFYRRKYAGLALDDSADLLARLPLITRQEIEGDQQASPPYGTLLTAAPDAYRRLHQTSGSTGRPLTWLDTQESWLWWQRCWAVIYHAAGVTCADRLLFPFSFGPFIGFWAAFESAVGMGCFAVPAGGLSTAARLRLILDQGITVVCCTPTYALRLAEVAGEQAIDLGRSAVHTLIVAGEPGGNIPSTRSRIESAWSARVIDHAGMTEVGAWGFECREGAGGLHVMESEFIAEVIDPQTQVLLPEGQAGELVLTNLGRRGMPLIRYRTGDRVVLQRRPCGCGRSYAWLTGGILGRIDDMLIIRGNNVFPASIEDVLRADGDVAEFRIVAEHSGVLAELRIDVEPAAAAAPDLADRVHAAIVDRLHFRPRVALVPPGSLPRFDMKARRVQRGPGGADPGTGPR